MNILVLDLETTHLDPTKGDILQIAACPIINNQVWEIISHFFYTNRPDIETESAIKVNGLTKEVITKRRQEANAENVYPYFKDIISILNDELFQYTNVMVAHNAKFDTSWLKVHGGNIDHISIECTQTLAKKLLPHLKKYTLKSVHDHFFPDEWEEDKAHDARYDVNACAKIYLKLKELEEG